MQSQEILKIYGTDYKEMTKKLLREADLKGEIPSSDTKIGIKPNLVSPTARLRIQRSWKESWSI